MSVRIEQYDGGETVYVALDPDGAWARSEFPADSLTLDFNAQGGLIGIELVGSRARRAATALFEAVEVGADETLRTKLASIFA